MEYEHFAAVSLFLALVIILAGVIPIVVTQNGNITVDVNVSTAAAISVLPTDISWSQLPVGADGQIYNVTVNNIGSVNVTNLYVTVDTISLESSNPLRSGSASAYAASGLIKIRNETESEMFYDLGRLEWNLSEILTNENLDLSAGVTNFGHGWYRNSTGNEYLWKVENGSNGWCNTTDTVFKIKMDPENATQESRDLSFGTKTDSSPTASGNWSFHSLNASEPLPNYCVAVHYTCEKIYLYKYDKSSPFDTCSNSAYLTTEELAPGEKWDKLRVKPSIPQGFPGGDTSTSIIMFYASSA